MILPYNFCLVDKDNSCKVDSTCEKGRWQGQNSDMGQVRWQLTAPTSLGSVTLAGRVCHEGDTSQPFLCGSAGAAAPTTLRLPAQNPPQTRWSECLLTEHTTKPLKTPFLCLSQAKSVA